MMSNGLLNLCFKAGCTPRRQATKNCQVSRQNLKFKHISSLFQPISVVLSSPRYVTWIILSSTANKYADELLVRVSGISKNILHHKTLVHVQFFCFVLGMHGNTNDIRNISDSAHNIIWLSSLTVPVALTLAFVSSVAGASDQDFFQAVCVISSLNISIYLLAVPYGRRLSIRILLRRDRLMISSDEIKTSYSSSRVTPVVPVKNTKHVGTCTADAVVSLKRNKWANC